MREVGDDEVIAIVCADIHLSDKAPRVRCDESDWFEAMRRPLDQMTELARYYKTPIFCAGDIFDRWKASPALINFALKYLPPMYAVPGQHDLPLHNVELIENSAFWTMVLADRIKPIMEPTLISDDIMLHGFPWGVRLKANKLKMAEINIALVHNYFWMKDHKHAKAPKTHHASKFKEHLQGYHSVIFGDNHKGFKARIGGVPVFNCGTFMRRKLDELHYKPRVGLLCRSGVFLTHRLNIVHDKFKTLEEDFVGKMRKNDSDMEDLLNGLRDVQAQIFDYGEAIEFLMKTRYTKNSVRRLLLEALGRE